MTMVAYCDLLFQDCGFQPQQKRDFLALRYGGRKYLDQLSPAELHSLIDDLKARKGSPEEVDETEPDAELTARERVKRWYDK